jgi:serine/threonine protein kinase
LTDVASRLSSGIGDRYRVVRELGVGGMATVHLAHDEKHGRDVAIKVLHPDLAAALGSDRFLAEIRTTAKLQHPHILPLLDSGDAGGLLFYVMPLVTGESLRQRLDRERQLPVDDAIRIAREVASALDYAHRQGVVHRDIKPENILLHDGSALVADFGIALAVQSAGGQRMTQTGLSLGTPQYMSPEQAMGERTIDARSDIYSLAAVTYEMLTGEPPFTGATVQAVVAKVISAEPQAITMIRRNVSPAVAGTVHRALEKLPADRHASAADFAASLTNTGDAAWTQRTIATSSRPVTRSAWRSMAPWVAAVGLSAGAFLVGRRFAPPDENAVREPVMATLLPDDGEEWSGSGVHLALSADGRHVAMISRFNGETGMIVRSLDSLGSRRLANTKDAFYPFWSPDGRSIGFFADYQLKKIDLATGAVLVLCPAVRPGGGAWGADNVIIYVPERAVGLHRVAASGGTCEKLGVAGPSQALDGKPRFLADGRHFVSTTDFSAWLGKVGGDSLTKLTDLQRMRAVVAGPDYLLYRPTGSPSRSIFAQRIDVRSRKLVGEPVRILDGVPNPGGNTMLSASNNGVLVARIERGNEGAGRLFGRFERDGAIRDTLTAPQAYFGATRLSRGGTRLALGGWRLGVLDLSREGVTTVVAQSPVGRPMQFPAWAPHDTAIAFVTSDSGRNRIDVVNMRTTQVQPLVMGLARGRSVDLTDWSTDGRYLAWQYGSGGGSQWSEAWIHDLVTGDTRRAFEEAAHVVAPRIAPHGRLIAYQIAFGFSDAAVFVRPFPGVGPSIRVSPGSGVAPSWSPDGRELYYYDERSGLMAVRINQDASSLSAPTVAVSLSTLRSVAPTFAGTFVYDPTPDGMAFFGSVTRPEPVNLTIIMNWMRLLDAQR